MKEKQTAKKPSMDKQSDQSCQVQRIGEYRYKNKQFEFQVFWKNSMQTSWLKTEELVNCRQLVNNSMKQHNQKTKPIAKNRRKIMEQKHKICPKNQNNIFDEQKQQNIIDLKPSFNDSSPSQEGEMKIYRYVPNIKSSKLLPHEQNSEQFEQQIVLQSSSNQQRLAKNSKQKQKSSAQQNQRFFESSQSIKLEAGKDKKQNQFSIKQIKQFQQVELVKINQQQKATQYSTHASTGYQQKKRILTCTKLQHIKIETTKKSITTGIQTQLERPPETINVVIIGYDKKKNLYQIKYFDKSSYETIKTRKVTLEELMVEAPIAYIKFLRRHTIYS